MDTTKIRPEVRKKIRMVIDLYDNGRNELMEMLRVDALGKRGPEITLGLCWKALTMI